MQSTAAFKSLKVFDLDYAYLDSGAPASQNYTTWAFVHGMGINGAIFEKLLLRAHAHNLRIISIYRRGYSPSSGFEEGELAGIGKGKRFDEVEGFLRAQGVEIATFLAEFATQQGIPLADRAGVTGGIVLVGWSLGSVHANAVLAYLDELPGDTLTTLQKYLHTIVFHDALASYFGTPNTDRHDMSLLFGKDDRKRFDVFFDRVTAHYAHKSVTSGNPDDLAFNNPFNAPPSLHEISYAQRAEYTDNVAFCGCDGRLVACDTSAFATVARRALFDMARAEKTPGVRVRFMSGGKTLGVLVWSLWALRKSVESPPEALYGRGAEKARDIEFVPQTEGNHFVFWEDPEEAIQQYSAVIGG